MLLLLYGLETPDADVVTPPVTPEVEATPSGGGIGGVVKWRRSIIARTVEYRDAEDELVVTWLL